MRDLNNPMISKYRLVDLELKRYGSSGDSGNGMFAIPSLKGETIRIIASNEENWDHVSVSLSYRVPTWDEMEFIKRMFFEEHETVMQLHVPISEYINCHPYVLHLWRPQWMQIPRPPANMV